MTATTASPSLSRRSVLAGFAAFCVRPVMASGDKLVLIEAPSNLGLRPLRAGHEPGTWRAPEALRQAGLHRALSPARVESIPRPPYRFEAQPGTRIRNGLEIRSFSECLAAAVSRALERNEFPVVVGGDCSVLLGCLLGARGSGPVGLVHMDGHSDFFHPGNYDTQSRLGSAAGMDLALATGRGEALLATWDGSSLVDDAFVVQIGERDETDRDYAYRDIMQTTIRRIPVREVLQAGIASSLVKALAPVGAERRRLWLHVDLDVLDGAVLPAVDSPGSPGLRYEQLADLLAGFLASKRVLGIDVTIFDPDLDPEGRYARDIVACFARGIGPHLRATRTGT